MDFFAFPNITFIFYGPLSSETNTHTGLCMVQAGPFTAYLYCINLCASTSGSHFFSYITIVQLYMHGDGIYETRIPYTGGAGASELSPSPRAAARSS